jgi:hypothetical protein
MSRATTSVEPPGANGTIILIGRLGYAWAYAIELVPATRKLCVTGIEGKPNIAATPAAVARKTLRESRKVMSEVSFK